MRSTPRSQRQILAHGFAHFVTSAVYHRILTGKIYVFKGAHPLGLFLCPLWSVSSLSIITISPGSISLMNWASTLSRRSFRWPPLCCLPFCLCTAGGSHPVPYGYQIILSSAPWSSALLDTTFLKAVIKSLPYHFVDNQQNDGFAIVGCIEYNAVLFSSLSLILSAFTMLPLWAKAKVARKWYGWALTKPLLPLRNI